MSATLALQRTTFLLVLKTPLLVNFPRHHDFIFAHIMEGRRKYLYAGEKGRTREKETSPLFCPLSSISHINPFPKRCVISHKGRELFAESIIFPHPPTQKNASYSFGIFLLLLNIMEGGVQTHIHLREGGDVVAIQTDCSFCVWEISRCGRRRKLRLLRP